MKDTAQHVSQTEDRAGAGGPGGQGAALRGEQWGESLGTTPCLVTWGGAVWGGLGQRSRERSQEGFQDTVRLFPRVKWGHI